MNQNILVTYGITIEHVAEALFRRMHPTEEDHLRHYSEIQEFLIVRARQVAWEQAISYRNFRVGCAVYAYNSKAARLGEIWKIFVGANLKPDRNIPTMCAERNAINSARAAGYQRIIGLAVAGEPEQDEENSIKFRTLHPCAICRQTLSLLPEITPETRVLTVRLTDESVREAFTFQELLNLHGENPAST